MRRFLFLALAALSVPTVAQTQRHLLIQSKADQFELVLNGSSGTVNGKPADLSAFNELLPVLRDPVANDCTPPKSAADVTVRENGQTRYIYIAQGLVSDGKNCLTVAGEGLNYFPIHRDFLIGPKQETVPVRSPFKLFRQGVKVFELKQSHDGWEQTAGDLLLDWDFVEHLMNSLHAYRIRFRVVPEMAKDKLKVLVQSGETSYEFYKLTPVLWAVKRPGAKWLEASDDWSFWYGLEDSVLTDRFASAIRVIQDNSKDKGQRLSALEKVKGSWSRNLRDLYHKLVLNENEDSEIKALAFQHLRRHPSHETAGVMCKFLATRSGDDDNKRTATQILKTIYPKGPLYNPSSPAEEHSKVVEFWTHWWDKNSHTP